MTSEAGLAPIGILHSCYTDKFGIPRQSRLVSAGKSTLELFPEYAREEAFSGLESFSHLWLVFIFHDCISAGWKPTVRPPRLGGRRKVGVFASRAPYRPNPIGISAVENLGLERAGPKLFLRLGGVDVLDGSPVLDVKPYVPYADSIPNAKAGFATEPPGRRWSIEFSAPALNQIAALDRDESRQLKLLITQVLQQDPRPGYMDRYPARTEFGMRLFDLEIQWRTEGAGVRVLSVEPAASDIS